MLRIAIRYHQSTRETTRAFDINRLALFVSFHQGGNVAEDTFLFRPGFIVGSHEQQNE